MYILESLLIKKNLFLAYLLLFYFVLLTCVYGLVSVCWAAGELRRLMRVLQVCMLAGSAVG